MPNIEPAVAQEAKYGEQMIEVKVRFWTNDITPTDGNVFPKHAWSTGIVRMERNKSHGIAPRKSVPFNSLLTLGTAIDKVLIQHGIRLHTSRQMKKYWHKNR